jgi:hypothetical protein
MKKKAFINFTLCVNALRLFSWSLTAGINKIDRLPKRLQTLSSLFVPDISDEEKRFHKFDSQCQRYKTFFFLTVGIN